VTALEFVNLIQPKHDRTSCSDTNQGNGFYSRNGETWHGRCTRCMYLELIDAGGVPDGFDPEECCG
jgi:hypothetical protein